MKWNETDLHPSHREQQWLLSLEVAAVIKYILCYWLCLLAGECGTGDGDVQKECSKCSANLERCHSKNCQDGMGTNSGGKAGNCHHVIKQYHQVSLAAYYLDSSQTLVANYADLRLDLGKNDLWLEVTCAKNDLRIIIWIELIWFYHNAI